MKLPISDYLNRWWFTPQRPTKLAYKQNPEKLNEWLDTQYPEIAARAKTEKAEIHWGDETDINNQAYDVKRFAPKGKMPIIRLHAKRSGINMISAITNQGKVRFMICEETMTSAVLIKFISRLVKDAQRKVFLVLDNLRVHHSKTVQGWLEEDKEKIEVLFSPTILARN